MGILSFLNSINQQKQDPPPTRAQTILASRQQEEPMQPDFGSMLQTLSQYNSPTQRDAGDAALQSAISGKYESPTALANGRFTDQLKQIQGLAAANEANAKASAYANGGLNGGGATMQAARQLMAENPNLDFTTAFSIAKSGLGQGNTIQNGQVTNIPGAPNAFGNIRYGQKGGELTAKEDIDRRANYTKAQSALTGFKQQADLVTKTIDDAIGSISGWSTGYGQMFSGLPNTDARKLNNYLNTIKSNVGFDKLQSMRDNSPTGGALGQVSDMENKLLQAVNGALDPMQRNQLEQNLQQIKKLYPAVLAEKQRAFQQDYGNVTPIGNNPVPPGMGTGQTPVPPGSGFSPQSKTIGGKMYIQDQNGDWYEQ